MREMLFITAVLSFGCEAAPVVKAVPPLQVISQPTSVAAAPEEAKPKEKTLDLAALKASARGEAADVEWMDRNPQCRKRGRRSYCDGPRLIPKPFGKAKERAKRLGIGTKTTYLSLHKPSSEELLSHIAEEPYETLHWPVKEGYLGRGFGHVRRAALLERLHKGIDIPAAEGAEVVSINAGIVIYANNGVEGYGNLVVILHKDDSKSLYAHLRAAYVFAGQLVERGQPIGEVGKTGLARANHLHMEWRKVTGPVDPERLFVRRPSPEKEEQLQIEQGKRRDEAAQALEERRARANRRALRRAMARKNR